MIHAKNRNSKSRDQQPTKSKQLEKIVNEVVFASRGYIIDQPLERRDPYGRSRSRHDRQFGTIWELLSRPCQDFHMPADGHATLLAGAEDDRLDLVHPCGQVRIAETGDACGRHCRRVERRCSCRTGPSRRKPASRGSPRPSRRRCRAPGRWRCRDILSNPNVDRLARARRRGQQRNRNDSGLRPSQLPPCFFRIHGLVSSRCSRSRDALLVRCG